MSKEELSNIVKEATKEAVAQALAEAVCCSAKHCGERCGITPVQHAEAHKKISDFFEFLGDVSKNVRGAIVKTIAMILIGATLLGLGLNIDKFIK